MLDMSNFSHLVLLGRQPELGLVELESLLGDAALEPFGREFVLLQQSADVAKLGGVIKLGRIIYDGAPTELQVLPIDLALLPQSESKRPFAVSVYGSRVTTLAATAAGLSLKKLLKTAGPVRLIAPTKGSDVSVAQLKHNRVIEDGFELVVVIDKSRMVISVTEQIQDIDWYSKRDYGRPARSAKVGMLPPKLAQILINSTRSDVVIDPFCGTGVVLQESLLMGRTAVGSDLAPDMVEATTQNLTWLSEQVTMNLPDWKAEVADAREVRLAAGSVAIVSEGYLGPNLTSDPSAKLDDLRMELGELYRAALRNWSTQLPTGADVALCVPAWRTKQGWRYLGLVDDLPRLGYTVKVLKHAHSPLLYARDDQIVGRQLLLLRKM